MRRPEAPGPGRPEAGPAPTPPRPGLPSPPGPCRHPRPPGPRVGAEGRRERHLHHGSGDDPGHHLPGGLTPRRGRVGARWRTRRPTVGRAPSGSSHSPGPRWRPREPGPVSARGGRSCAAVGPPHPSPPACGAAAEPASPAPTPADRRRRRVGRGQVWAARLRGWAAGTPACAGRPCGLALALPSLLCLLCPERPRGVEGRGWGRG